MVIKIQGVPYPQSYIKLWHWKIYFILYKLHFILSTISEWFLTIYYLCRKRSHPNEAVEEVKSSVEDDSTASWTSVETRVNWTARSVGWFSLWVNSFYISGNLGSICSWTRLWKSCFIQTYMLIATSWQMIAIPPLVTRLRCVLRVLWGGSSNRQQICIPNCRLSIRKVPSDL